MSPATLLSEAGQVKEPIMGRRKKGTEVDTQEPTGQPEGHQNGQPEKKQPAFKVGPIPTGVNESIDVCVWAREAQYDNRTVTLYSVTLQASYRDQEEWKRSSSLKPNQIPVAMFALQRAFDHIMSCKDKHQPF